MPRDPSNGIYPSNMTVILLLAQCQLTSTSTSTNYLRNGAWNSATLYPHHKGRCYRQRTRRTCSNSQRETGQKIPSSGWQFPPSASKHFSRNILDSLGIKQIHDSTRTTHLVISKKLLRYLKGRKNVTLWWCAQDCTGAHLPDTIYEYSDASLADTIPHRHSSVGYVFLINGAAVS